MRSNAPALMPIFRSRPQAKILSWLLLHPDQEYSMTELSRRLDVPLTTLHSEARRLTDAELLRVRSVGRNRQLRANTDHPAAAALTSLMEVTFGPHTVIAEEFGDLEGAVVVLIYGSWAARYHGTPGPPPADVDVLVVGTSARADVYEAADRAQDRLGLQVNPVLRSLSRWRSEDDPLLEQIKTAPTVTILREGGEAS